MNTTNLPYQPQDMNACFAAAYNSGDAANMGRLFEPEAKVVGKNGETIAARADHENLLKLGGKMTSVNKYCIQFENIALLRADWKIETTDAEGKELVISGSSTEVVRRQPDGSWLYVIDNPFGAGPME